MRWHNGGDPGCPFNFGDSNAVEATANAVYIGGHLHLTDLCTVMKTSYTARCPGALTVRRHVAALDPLSWNPGAGGTKIVLVIQAMPAGLGIGGDVQRTNGVAHSRFALLRGSRNRRSPPDPERAAERNPRHEPWTARPGQAPTRDARATAQVRGSLDRPLLTVGNR